MSMKRMLAKGLYKLAEGTIGEFQNEHAVRSDLGPVLKRIDKLEEKLLPRWVGISALVLSGLTFVLAVWILVRVH